MLHSYVRNITSFSLFLFISSFLTFAGNISAIFTYKRKGEELARLAENDSKVMVHITFASQTNSRGVSINR